MAPQTAMRRRSATAFLAAVAIVTGIPATAAHADNNVTLSEAHTDLARYAPGQQAVVTAELSDNDGWTGPVTFTLSHLGSAVATGTVQATVPAGATTNVTWSVTPPGTDFTGYFVEVKAGTDSAGTAIDVSSDWSVFPRMGYLDDYSASLTGTDQEAVIDELVQKYHLNALQYYDWMWRHEKPVERDANGQVVNTWTAWNGDVIAPATVQGYIDAGHDKNVAALPYSMSYAALEGFQANGVNENWRMKYAATGADWSFAMLQNTPSTVLWMMDPNNPNWQDHITNEYADQLNTFGFDGTHLDQLGNWGKNAPGGDIDGGMTDANGVRISIPNGFASLVTATKTATGGAVTGLNAVDGFGGDTLAQSDSDYLYTELWEDHETYAQVQEYLDRQRQLSNGKPAVIAAYLNNHSNTGARYEAEDAVRGGGTQVNNNHTGYTGTGFVDSFGQAGDSVTFTIDVPETRRYGLVPRYTNGTTSTSRRTVSVDGQVVGHWNMQSSGSWTDWKFDARAIAELSAGQHTVKVSLEPGDSGYINLDSLTLGTFDTPSVQLANAAIAASGATHIEMGQDNQMLSAPYFLDHSKQMSLELEQWQKAYYDVITAYENVLYGPTLTSTDNAIQIAGQPTSTDGAANTVWTTAKQTDKHDVIHLINLKGNSNTWREGPKNAIPKLVNLPVKYYLDAGVTPTGLHLASPDRNDGASQDLAFNVGSDGGGRYVQFVVPELSSWSFVYLDRASTPATLVGNIAGDAGKCITTAGTTTSNGTATQLAGCADTPEQEWTFEDNKLKAQGKCLDIVASGTTNGSLTHMWDCNPVASQTWTRTADRQYRNPASGRCLDVVNQGTTDGTRLHLWDCHTGNSQKWSLPQPPPLSVGNISGWAGKCIAVVGATTNGTATQLAGCADTPEQEWTFEDNKLKAQGKCLDIVASGTTNGSLTHMWDCNPVASQTWTRTADTQYRNPASRRCLDVVNQGTTDGTRLHLWDCHTGNSQKWSLPQ